MLWKKSGRPTLADLNERLDLWCERWAPEVPAILRRSVAKAVHSRPRLDDADECAARLRLSYDERTLLGITTIGSFDVNKRGRAKLRKARKLIRDRERAAIKRAERGAVPRSEYLATSLSATQPWKAEGISRRTWERRRRAAFFDAPSIAGQHDASPSPSSTAPMLGDTPASPVDRRGQRAAHAGPHIHAGDISGQWA